MKRLHLLFICSCFTRILLGAQQQEQEHLLRKQIELLMGRLADTETRIARLEQLVKAPALPMQQPQVQLQAPAQQIPPMPMQQPQPRS